MQRLLLFAILALSAPPVFGEWSVFEPLEPVTPPQVDIAEWSEPVDAFVWTRLQEAGVLPAPAVDRRTWIRRVSYDLVGLPPSPIEVQEFLHDPRPDRAAMLDVVNRLLESPRYGERWGRHWLDVVRYADSDGFAIDEERLTLWRYRDYVIRSLNEDRPFDQFFREQIAGDELKEAPDGRVAISFYRLGPYEADNMTKEHRRQDYLNEITSAVGSAFLGLTVGCARCHDHRFDPILQTDFYQLQAFFTPLKRETIEVAYLPGEITPSLQRRLDVMSGVRATRQRQLDALTTALKKKLAAKRSVKAEEIDKKTLDAAIKELAEPITEEDRKRVETLRTQLSERKTEQRFEPRAVAVRNPPQADDLPKTFLLYNGDVFDPGEQVQPGFLSAVADWSESLPSRAAAADEEPSGRRAVLAAWLTSPHNPITSRVLANRIWQYHFGVGIVATPNDFGENGTSPTHPDLLDYLAQRLIDGGWRLKSLHRELVLSRTYRLSTQHPEADALARQDPENRLLWRAHYRRLEAETMRDAMLAVSNRLRLEMGGPGFYEALPDGMESSYPFFEWHPSGEDQRRRRSIYMFQRRNLVHPLIETFDGPDLSQSCEKRSVSVTAPQALSLLNGRFAAENSLHLARRLREHSYDDDARVDRLFWLAFSRSADKGEQQECLEFLAAQEQMYRDSVAENDEQKTEVTPRLAALRDLCLAVLNSNEFLYLD